MKIRRARLFAISVAILAPSLVAAQAPRVVESEYPYVRALSKVWAAAWALPISLEWCGEKYPSTASASKAALNAWREKSDGLIVDLKKRMNTLMIGSGWEPSQLEAKYARSRREAWIKFDSEMSAGSGKKQEQECAHLPVDFAEGKFDFELIFAAELKLIREHPIEVERPTNP